MPRIRRSLLGICVLISLFAVLNIVVFGVSIILANEVVQVSYTPDDGYYYLTLARNFRHLGIWSFDSGHSVTSGFHLAFAYLLAVLYGLVEPSLEAFVRYGLVVGITCSITTLFAVWLISLRNRQLIGLLVLALLTSSSNFVYNTVSITEWPLVVLVASAYMYFYWHNLLTSDRRVQLALFFLGIVGSLSRSDFGLLPLAYCAVAFLVLAHTEASARKGALFGLLGAIVGVLLLFLHNYAFTGEMLQSSARMKLHWMTVRGGTNILGSMGLLADASGASDLRYFIAAAGTVLYLSIVGALENMKKLRNQWPLKSNRAELAMFAGAVVCIVGYTFLYTRNADIQPWYSANLIVPIFIALSLLFGYVSKWLGFWFEVGLACAIVVVVTFNVLSVYPIAAGAVPWPHQRTMLAAGRYLSSSTFDGGLGSWNAGIIGYYQGGNVVNLDGLVNNDVYPYIMNNALPAYLSLTGIRYIVDFENMLYSEGARRRGGYDCPEFISKLRAMEVFDQEQYGWVHLTLYELVSE